MAVTAAGKNIVLVARAMTLIRFSRKQDCCGDFARKQKTCQQQHGLQ
jgi:hypothetical protein